MPIVIFAFLFGISMDYQVFIISRMREAYDRTGSTETAVVEGIGRTGRLVTSAALIMFLAFVAFSATPGTEAKMFATALGGGILIDATIIRGVLAPAAVALLGRWNWWLPTWAARLLRVAPSETTREATGRARYRARLVRLEQLPGRGSPPPALLTLFRPSRNCRSRGLPGEQAMNTRSATPTLAPEHTGTRSAADLQSTSDEAESPTFLRSARSPAFKETPPAWLCGHTKERLGLRPNSSRPISLRNRDAGCGKFL